MRLPRHNRRVAPVSKDGAAPWFETPRTRLRNRNRPKIAAPHHEAERDSVRITQVRLRRQASTLKCGTDQWRGCDRHPRPRWRARKAIQGVMA
jgi:hypothetical protein